jgi:hypothetical protein
MNKSLYGRKWLLKILCSDGTLFEMGNDGISEEQSLKCAFEINYPGYEGWYFSEFNIWNPTKETERKIIQEVGEGSEVYFYAGYSKGKYGQIFGGKVFQVMFTREQVTDYKLTLICMDGERLFKDNFVNFTLDEYTDQTLLNEVAARAKSTIPVGTISSGIDNRKKFRGATFLGRPDKIVREVVRRNSAQMFMKDGELNVVKLTDAPQGNPILVDPSTGLIGTPQQTDFGISFRVLLNPEIILTSPLSYVKLDLSQINVQEQKRTPSQNPNAPHTPKIPKDGFFSIGGVRHIGDTRGNDWYTDVVGYGIGGRTGLTPATMLNDQTGGPTADPNG